jgi:hypothetical protein
MGATSDYFDGLTPEDRDRLDTAARRCPLSLPKMPMDRLILQEVLAWQRLEIDVLDAHADWLARTKAKFERRGVEWTTDNLNRYSRLWELE